MQHNRLAFILSKIRFYYHERHEMCEGGGGKIIVV